MSRRSVVMVWPLRSVLSFSMPGQGLTKGGDFGLSLEDLVKAGDVPESRIDDMARRCVFPRFLALT